MSDKSYVTMEQHQCPVCGKTHDTGNILMDQRLRERFERFTVTGMSLCPEHKKLHDDGYLALVAVDPAKSKPDYASGHIKPENAWRTGKVAHLKHGPAAKMFDNLSDPLPEFVFCDDEVIDKLIAMSKNVETRVDEGEAT